MPRHVATLAEREVIVSALKKLTKRKDVGGPTVLAAIDRLAHIWNLYHVELVRPKERPDKWANPNPPSLPEPEAPVQDKKTDELYQRYLEEEYNKGERDERAKTASTGTAATGSASPAS